MGLALVLACVFSQKVNSQIISWDFTSGNTPNTNLPAGTTALSFNTGGTIATFGCTGFGYSSTGWNVGEYLQIVAPITGYEITTLTFNVRSSGTGPGNFKVQYSSTGTSGTFTDLTSGGTFTSGNGVCLARSFDLSAINALDNNANTVIRLVFTGGEADGSPATGDAAGGGTFRIDDLIINGSIVSTPCSGTPTPGNTISSAASVSSGSTVNLSLQNATTGSGVTYQWFSSTTSATGPWTTIGGATISTYSTAVSVPTWFKCDVTCSSNTGSSTPVGITILYCTSTGTSSSYFINNFSTTGAISNITNTNSGYSTNGYINTGMTVSQAPGSSISFSVSFGSQASYAFGFCIWVDWNDDYDFADPGETMFSSGAGQSTTYTNSFTVPVSATLGCHRMRIVADYVGYPSVACNPSGISGETEDYCLTVAAACTAPTTQASIGAYTSTSPTGTTVNWTRGNGTGGVIVVARLTSTSAVTPANGTSYTPNSAFGSGTGSAITGTGNFVVYNGTGTSVNVTGLSGNSNYTFTVYEYNTASTCYLIPGSSSAVSTPCLPFTGTYSVGSGNISGEAGHYATLTAAVADYNTRCITGPLVFLLTDATYSTGTGETFPITINSNGYASAVNTLTIEPNTGVNSTITANSTSATIILNGADYVTIDGSNGSTVNSVCPRVKATRNLTIINTNTGASQRAVVWLQSTGTNGATNNTIKNCIITGNSSSTTVFGVGSADNTLQFFDTNGGNSNNNNTIENNGVSLVQYGIYSVGKNTSSPNTGTVIQLNDVTNCGQAGIFSGFENGTLISGNFLNGITTTSSSSSVVGIGVGLAFASTSDFNSISEGINYTISYNTIGTVFVTNTYSANGIVIGSTSSGTHTIQNNFIYGVYSNGTGSDYASGIHIGGGAAQFNVYHNTISMQGTITGSSSASNYSVCVSVPNSTFKLNLRNNILSNTQVGNSGATVKFGCIYTQASPFYSNFVSNYNNLYCAGSGPGSYQIGFYGGGSAQSTIAIWRTGTNLDLNSVNVAPVFTSTTDLHLQAVAGNTSLDNTGTNLSISNDIDCDSRSTTPDIGADEFSISVCTGTPNTGVASITISSGCASTPINLSATGLTVAGGITYQWQSSPTGLIGSWTNISGANAATYSTTSTTTIYYQLVTTCSNGGGTNTTNIVSFTVTGSPCTCLTYPAIYANNVADNDLTSVTVGSMTNTSTCGFLAPGAGSIAFRYSNYTGSVSGPSAAQGASVSFSLTENLCAGGSNNQNNFLIYIDWNQDGDFADANEKMFSQIDSGPSTGLVNTQTLTGSFVVPMTALMGVTRMRVINTGGSFPSSNYAQTDAYTQGETEDYCFTVTSASGPVCPNAATIAPTSTQTICQNGTTTQLTASYTTGGVTGTPTVQYQWYYNTTSSNTVSGATIVAGQTTSTFTPPSTTIGTRFYFCVVYATDNGCGQTNTTQSLASNVVQVTIVDPTTVTASITQGATASFCSGSSVTLNANTGAGLTYQWQLNGSPIGGANSSTYAASSAGTYSVVVTGSGGCSATSSGTVVSSNPTPTITAQTSTICSGQAFTVSPASAPSGTTYTWSTPTLNPLNSITGGSAQPSPQPSISQTLTNTTTASATATYTVTPTSGTCVGSTFTVAVTVDPPVNYGTVASVSGATAVNHLVISQVYGGGGNTYRYDYIEIFNPTPSAVSIDNWTIQYQTQGQSTWSTVATIPVGTTLSPGQYYLIHASDGTTGAVITADLTGTTSLNATQGKMALVNNNITLTSCTQASIVDKVGYGTTSISCNETANAPAPNSTNAIWRASNGCADTDNNGSDFTTGTPTPRNSASPLNPCAVIASTTFCGSGIPGAMSVTGVAGGTSYSYQWYSQTGAISCPTGSSTAGWTSLGATNGANTAIYTPTSAINATTTYACLVTINGSSCSTSQWSSSCITITINPSASLLPMSTAICTGNTISFTPTTGTNGTIPTSTTFTWTAPTMTGVSGGTSGSGTTISNAFTGSGTAVYTLTPTTGTCVGATATLTVTVDPCLPIQNCNLLVYAVGDGTTSLSGNSDALPVRLLEISQSGSLVQSINSLFTGNNLLTAPGSVVSQGFLNSYNGFTAVPGLNLNVYTTNSNTNNNKVTSIINGGFPNLVARQVHPTSGTVPFTGDNYRSVIPISSTTFYAAGNASNSTNGIWYYDGSNFNQLAGLNARNVEIFNNQLYVSQSSAINEVGTGMPTSGTQALNQIVTYTNASIYDFSISPDGCTMYVADNGFSIYRGVTKWTKSTINGTWTAGINYSCYGYGLVVDYSGSSNIIYLTMSTTNATAAPDKIICLTDNGSFTLNWTYTAASNFRLSGIDFTPNSTSVIANPITTQPVTSANLCNSQTQTLSVVNSGSAMYQWYSNTVNSTCGATAIVGATSASYTPPATGIDGIVYYFVKVSVNCTQIFLSNISAITTVINPTPTATNNGPICVGGILTLQTPTVSGASYSWIGPNSFSSSIQNPTVTSNATVSNAGTYNITTTVSGCTSQVGTTNVTINQSPVINAISPP